MLIEKEESAWGLEQELADYFGTYVKKHISDSDMLNEMQEYPPPANLKDLVPVLDPYMKKTLTEEGKGLVKDQDGDLATIQNRMLEIMGPLGAAWASLELHKCGEADLDIENVADQVKKAAILVGHAMNKVSWFRRLHVLGQPPNSRAIIRLRFTSLYNDPATFCEPNPRIGAAVG